jgi:hypothetical protein
MNEPAVKVVHDNLPFYITGPGESDILLIAVAIALAGIVIGFGALYFTIQAIPDRIAKGSSKAQMQLVGLLGLISLFTMNNLYWVAAILLAAVRIPDFVTPLKDIARSLRHRTDERAESKDSQTGESGENSQVSSTSENGEALAVTTATRTSTGDD